MCPKQCMLLRIHAQPQLIFADKGAAFFVLFRNNN